MHSPKLPSAEPDLLTGKRISDRRQNLLITFIAPATDSAPATFEPKGPVRISVCLRSILKTAFHQHSVSLECVSSVFETEGRKISRKVQRFDCGQRAPREIPPQLRYLGGLSFENLFQIIDSRTGGDRRIYEEQVKYDYGLKESADHLKILYSAVSKVLSRKAKEREPAFQGLPLPCCRKN